MKESPSISWLSSGRDLRDAAGRCAHRARAQKPQMRLSFSYNLLPSAAVRLYSRRNIVRH